MGVPSRQGVLFAGAPVLPPGLTYRADFITPGEELELIAAIRTQPLEEARYKTFTAKRRIASFGLSYDFDTNELGPAPPIPGFLHPLRAAVAAWAGVPATEFQHALIAEYRPGTQLGWHRDVPNFEVVVGVSLGAPCRLRLRRYPSRRPRAEEPLVLVLAARSVYALRDEARWRWQHAISPTKAPRYSITFRSRRAVD